MAPGGSVKSYGTTPLPKPGNKLWSTSDYEVTVSLFLLVFTLTVGSYYYYALLPAWEADSDLGWTKRSTLIVNWTTTLCEALGLLLAGPMADYIEPVPLIALEGAVTFLAAFITCLLQTPYMIIMGLLLVSFLKGLLWPSLGSIIYHSIELEKQDVVFFCCALASRFSEAFGDLALGQLLFWGFTWRSALAFFGSGCLALFAFGIFSLKQSLALGVHVEIEEPPDSPTWSASYTYKWHRLVGDACAWMAFAVLLGTSGIWALAGYLAVLMQAKFDLSPGAAATTASSLLGGTFVGLLFAGMVTYVKGRSIGRGLQLVQGNVGLLALLCMVMMPQLGMGKWILCLFFAGAGAGPLMYLPYTVYCSSVPRYQRAFSMGVLDSISQLFGCFVSMFFGNLRIVIPEHAGQVMYDGSALGFAMTAGATFFLYRRLGPAEDMAHF
eukprot:Skav205598  [mRNA]  locus=scaffold460:149955:151271:+ [translate_table: standard]